MVVGYHHFRKPPYVRGDIVTLPYFPHFVVNGRSDLLQDVMSLGSEFSEQGHECLFDSAASVSSYPFGCLANHLKSWRST